MVIYVFELDFWTLKALPDTRAKCEAFVGDPFCKKYTDKEEFTKDYNNGEINSFTTYIRIFE